MSIVKRPSRGSPCADWLWALLNDAECPADATDFERFCYRFPDAFTLDNLRDAWLKHRDVILADFAVNRPGEVPTCTRFDNPKETK